MLAVILISVFVVVFFVCVCASTVKEKRKMKTNNRLSVNSISCDTKT